MCLCSVRPGALASLTVDGNGDVHVDAAATAENLNMVARGSGNVLVESHVMRSLELTLTG